MNRLNEKLLDRRSVSTLNSSQCHDFVNEVNKKPMSKHRPPINDFMKRAIRQRCGFGCIICGKPIYEYHHIEGFNEAVGHIEQEITLLCDSCHRKEQSGLISRDYVLRRNDKPFNIIHGVSAPDRIWYAENNCYVRFGSNVHGVVGPGSFVPLLIDGLAPIQIKFERGQFLLSLMLLDAWNRHILVVQDNELRYSTLPTDIEYQGGTITVKAQNIIILQAKFKSPELTVSKAIFFYNGVAVNIDGQGLYVVNENQTISSNTFVNVHVAVACGRIPAGFQQVAVHCPVPERLFPIGDATKFKRIPEEAFSMTPQLLNPKDYE